MNPADGGTPQGPPHGDPPASTAAEQARLIQELRQALYQTQQQLQPQDQQQQIVTQQNTELSAQWQAVQSASLQHTMSNAAGASQAQTAPQQTGQTPLVHTTVTSLNVKPPKPESYKGGRNPRGWLFQVAL